MSGYLHRLVARTLGQANVVRPRLRPRFLASPGDDRIEAEIATLLQPTDRAVRSLRTSSVEGSSSDSRVTPCHAELVEGLSKGDTPLAPADVVPPSAPNSRVTLSLSKGDSAIDPLAPNVFVYPNSTDGSPTLRQAEGDATGAVDANALTRSSGFVTASDDRVALSKDDAPLAADGFLTQRPDDDRVTLSSSKGDTAHDRTPPAIATPSAFDDTVTRRQPFDRLGVRQGDAFGELAPARIAHSLADPAQSERESAEGATVVNVSIGRIEVRSAPEPPMRVFRDTAPPAPKPREQLDAYLRGRATRR